jgi:hypothetical protein
MQSQLIRRFAALAVVSIVSLCAATAQAQAPAPGGDYIASANVSLLKSIKPAGDGVGARVVGHYLYVTSTKDLEIYDISTPEDPQMVGSLNLHVEFENEEVPTNGKVLGISGQTPTVTGSGNICPSTYPLLSNSGCLVLYDVRDPAAPKEVSTVLDAGDHTSTCVLDCTFFYGSAGSITDAQGVLDGVQAKKIGNWYDSSTIPDFNGPNDGGKFVRDCHNLTEIKPGILMAACQPFLILSVRPEDGGTILQPKLLATGSNEDGRFIHGNHWPRAGEDQIALVGGEHNFQPNCSPPDTEIGAFMTFDASHANLDGKFDGPLDEWRPTNGAYLDSNPPTQILGCSAHWFDEHPTFKNGGLVAVAAYENGTRFFQIGSDGKITEQGFFVPLGGATSAPHWAPSSDVVYAVDYERGLDVLQYKGAHFVPGAPPEEGKVPGTNGPPAGGSPGGPPAGGGGSGGGGGGANGSGAPVCKASAGFLAAAATPYKHVDHGQAENGLKFSISRRAKKPFDVAVVRQARGRKLTRNQTVAHFKSRTRSFVWSGAGASDGWYVVRFRMALDGGTSDVRRIAVRRAHGKFVKRPASYLRDNCGALKSFKLARPVFGGSKHTPLKVTYELPRGVDSVSVVASARGKVLKRFKGTGADSGQMYELSLPAKGIARGTDVQVRLTLVRAGSRQSVVLVSRRI